jgi:RHS repeat-associated protein
MQVDSVKEDALPLTYTGAFDFVSKTIPTTGVQYAYYDDGSLKWDANKGICLIEYDRHGYPQRVQFYNGNVTEYAYAADGEKLRTIYRTAVPNITVPLGTTISLNSSNTLSVDSINYVGDFIYENGQLKNYLFDGGYATISNGLPTYHYYAKDHLGNNRAVINHSTGEIEQVTHYYPFGAVYGDAGTNDALQRYKYNGKELDRMHGLNFYDYGARQYDPLLGMFTQMDPMAEKYYGISPYAYCANNPVMLVDPDGNSPLSALIKVAAKQGVKSGIKTYIKKNIEHRLKKYMSKDMLKQFAKDADDVMGALDNSWWETALELVPVAGDIYGGSKFAKQMTTVYNKLQDLENKYVGKIAKSLPDKERKKFIKNMRSKGVADARKDQAKGLDVGGEVKYKKGEKIDGHHTEKVSKNPDKMTDPRTIEFMEQSDHIKYHQQNGY